MFYVVERYHPRRCHFEFQRSLSRHATQEQRDEPLTVQYVRLDRRVRRPLLPVRQAVRKPRPG
jgi:hypothetical protein